MLGLARYIFDLYVEVFQFCRQDSARVAGVGGGASPPLLCRRLQGDTKWLATTVPVDVLLRRASSPFNVQPSTF
jgi:hypothetical protein